MTTLGVPTEYGSTMFRSRLEARWAAFADLAGWQWVYEPFDGKGYLPDFAFTVAGRPLLVEVKPVATIEESRKHLPKIINGIGGLWNHDLVIAGVDPFHCLYVDFINGPEDWHSCQAVYSQCIRCNSEFRIHADGMGFGCDTTGSDKWSSHIAEDDYVNHLWREAGNRTRWNPAS